jgi:hypothetical protein
VLSSAVAPDGTFYVGTPAGVFRSSNEGASWEATAQFPFALNAAGLTGSNTAMAVVRGLAITSNGALAALVMPSRDYVTAPTIKDGIAGVYISTDKGASWRRSAGVLADEQDAIAYIVALGNTLLLCTPYNSNVLLRRSTDNGTTWTDITTPEVTLYLSPNLSDFFARGSLLFAPAATIKRASFSADGGTTWQTLTASRDAVNDAAVLQTGSTSSNRTIFVAAEDGLYRSRDGGTTWTDVRTWTVDGKSDTNRAVITVAVKGSTILASTRRGIFRSTDDGATWAEVTPPRVRAEIVYPQRVMAGVGSSSTLVLGMPFGFGTFRSTDDGRTWQASNTGITAPVVDALYLGSPNAGTGQNSEWLATTFNGMFRSRNQGQSWEQTSTSLPGLHIDGFALHRGRLYAATYLGLYRSGDGGATWDAVPFDTGASWQRRVFGIGSLPSTQGSTSGAASGASTSETLYISVQNATYFSNDEGRTWTKTPIKGLASTFVFREGSVYACGATTELHRLRQTLEGVYFWDPTSLQQSNVTSLTLSPSGTMVAAANNGDLFRSFDAGKTWRQADRLGNAVGYNPVFAPWGTMFVSYESNLFSSTDNGATWTRVAGGLFAGIRYYTRPDNLVFTSSRTVLAQTAAGLYETQQRFEPTLQWVNYATGLQGGNITGLMASSGNGGATLYASTSDEIWRSSDGGATWSNLNVVFPTANNNVPNAAFINPAISALAVSGNMLLAGMGRGLLRSVDGGKQWQATSITRPVTALAVLPNGVVMASLGFGYDSNFTIFYGGVAMSSDGGATWTDVNSGLNSMSLGAYQLTVKLESNGSSQAATLFTLTDGGLYRARLASLADTRQEPRWERVTSEVFGFASSPDVLAVSGNALFIVSLVRGLLRSTDDGATWTEVEKFKSLGNAARVYSVTNAANSAVLASEIFVKDRDTTFRSRDGGMTWQASEMDARQYLRIPSGLLCGTVAGVWRAEEGTAPSNAALRWTQGGLPNALNINQLVVSGSRLFAGGVLVFSSDTKTSSPWQRANSLTPRPQTTMLLKPFGGALLAQPFGSGSGTDILSSFDNGTTWRPLQSLFQGPGNNIDNSSLQRIFTSTRLDDGSLAVDEATGRAAERFTSQDGGVTWAKSSSPNPVTQLSREGLKGDGIVGSVRTASNRLFATTSAGVFRFNESDNVWTEVNAGLTRTSVAMLLPSGASSLYAVLENGGGVFESRNNGNTWTEINFGLPNRAVTSIAFDGSGYLYAASPQGVFRSEQPVRAASVLRSGATLVDFGELAVRQTSPVQSLSITGSNLVNEVTVESVAGIDIAIAASGPWRRTLVLPHVAGEISKTIFVRASTTATGVIAGAIQLASGITTASVRVQLNSFLPRPTLTAEVGRVNFSNASLGSRQVRTYKLRGSYLTGDVIVSVLPPFAVSATGQAQDFRQSVTLPVSSKERDSFVTDVFVSFTPPALGVTTATLLHVSPNAQTPETTASVELVGVGVPALPAPTLQTPENGRINVSTTPLLAWTRLDDAMTYTVQVSSDSTFSDDRKLAITRELSSFSLGVQTPLQPNTKYFWRVLAKTSGSQAGLQSDWSATGVFTTIRANVLVRSLTDPVQVVALTSLPQRSFFTLTAIKRTRLLSATWERNDKNVFTLNNGQFPQEFAANASATIVFDFKPASVGRFEAIVNVRALVDGVEDVCPVQIIGTALDTANAVVTLVGIETDSATVNSGAPVKIRLVLKDSRNLDDTKARNFNALIKIRNPSVMTVSRSAPTQPEGLSEDNLAVSGKNVELRNIPRSAGMQSGVLAEFEATATTGDSVATAIEFLSFAWNDGSLAQPVATVVADSSLTVNVCKAGGTRLYLQAKPTMISVISPNPTIGEARVDFTIGEKGEAELFLVDVRGARVKSFGSRFYPLGDHSTTLSVADVPSGSYMLMLQTQSDLAQKRLEVKK